MPPKKADSKNGDSPNTTSNQRAPPGNPQRNVDRHRTNPSDHVQSTVASRSTQQPPQRVGSGSEARPSNSGGPVTANSWAKVAAGHSRGSLSQPRADKLPTHPVVMPLPPGVTQGPTFGTPQHQIPQTNVPTPNSRQRASQQLQQVPSHAQSTNPMNTIRSGISSMNLKASTGISQKASPSPQIPNIHQSSKSQLEQDAYPSSTDRMPALPATKSSAPATISSTKPSTADSNRQSKAFDEESPQDANFFELNVSKSVKLVRYSIEVTRQAASVEITNGGLRSQCIRLALQEAGFVRYRNRIVTDHQANLYSVVQLPEELHTTNIQYRDEHSQTTSPNARNYVITLKEGRTFDISSLVPKIVSEDLTIGKESRSEILTALNIFLHDFAQRQPTSITYLRDKCFHLGHHSSRHNLFGGLEAIPGFFSSVRPASDKLMVNVNPSRGAFYKVLRLDHLMYEWDEAWKDRGSWDAVELDALQAFLKGLRIKALHLNKKNGKGNPCPWIKRISGLAQTTDGQTPPPTPGDKTNPPAQDPSKTVSLPPVVDVKGANPSQVQFWHDKKNMYVPVSDHFKEDMSRSCFLTWKAVYAYRIPGLSTRGGPV
ncbi:MAG: hypothetical protein L6R42_003314 [Xanthoria sp. 1 TBL-2021]|nr:MAG: hypothetical protein L6R42_003314 [Xanthoria sp. 1 TBL-2021]